MFSNILKAAGLFLFLLLSLSCYADPQESDMVRVKEQFLVMRFHSAFQDEWKGRSDSEIFNLACQKSRVNCNEVLQYFKKKDRHFYDLLTESSAR